MSREHGKHLQSDPDKVDSKIMITLTEDEKLLLRSACVLMMGLLAGITYALMGKI